MTPSRRPSRDIVDILIGRIEQLERHVGLARNVQRPTVPIYDNTDYPQDAVEGQIAVGLDDNLHFFKDGVWHDVGGVGAYAAVWYDNTGTTITNPAYSIPTSTGGLYVPFYQLQTTDPAIFSLGTFAPNENNPGDKKIYLSARGTYIAQATVVWESSDYYRFAQLSPGAAHSFQSEAIPGGLHWSAAFYNRYAVNQDGTSENSSIAMRSRDVRAFYFDGSSSSSYLQLQVSQFSGVNKLVRSAAVSISYVPTADLQTIDIS